MDSTVNSTTLTQWYTLHINEGIASFAQERIFFDEQVRFSDKIAIYNELTALQVVQSSLSTDRLLRALECLSSKHKILRTSLIFKNDNNTLKQSITSKHQTFTLAAEKSFKNKNELHDIIYQTVTDPNLFDLSSGRVFHCQILRQRMLSNENNDNELITNAHVLILAFHHAIFDRSTLPIFFNDLCNAYNDGTVWSEDEESLQYIDYSVQERLIDMAPSCEFWRLQLGECNLERQLSLPFDRHRSSRDRRSGLASVSQISFNNETSTAFLSYASSHQVTPFQLGLATCYVFLFKLTYGQNVLCISDLNANRYRTELQNIMGMFVSILPYHVQVDPYLSFDELVKHVREKCLSILEHSHYPLQHILADFHLNQSTVPFLEVLFDFITISFNINELSFDGARLEQVSFKQSSEVANFDFKLTFVYDPASDNHGLLFNLVCSRDRFNETTVVTIGQRLRHLFEQLFPSNSAANQINIYFTPVIKLNLILPEEDIEIQKYIFSRQSNVVSEGMSIYL